MNDLTLYRIDVEGGKHAPLDVQQLAGDVGEGNRIVLAMFGSQYGYACTQGCSTSRVPRATLERAVVEELELTPARRRQIKKAMRFHLRHRPKTKLIKKFLGAL